MAKAAARNIITDKLVIELTKKSLEEWFEILDKAGAKKMSHIEIFNFAAQTPGLNKLGEWNQNLFTTSYEWSRGIKERGQKADGFEISVSKTIAAPLHELYDAFIKDVIRKKWLTENKLKITKATEKKSARVLWSDGSSRLSIDFYTKGPDKSQIVVQHLKLPDSAKAAEMKSYWSASLEKLQQLLVK